MRSNIAASLAIAVTSTIPSLGIGAGIPERVDALEAKVQQLQQQLDQRAHDPRKRTDWVISRVDTVIRKELSAIPSSVVLIWGKLSVAAVVPGQTTAFPTQWPNAQEGGPCMWKLALIDNVVSLDTTGCNYIEGAPGVPPRPRPAITLQLQVNP